MTVDVRDIRDRAVADLAMVRQQIEPLADNVNRLRTDVGRADAEHDSLLRQRLNASVRADGTAQGVATAQAAVRTAEHIAAGARADLTAIDARIAATATRRSELTTAYCHAAANLADADPSHVLLCHCADLDYPHAPHPGADPFEAHGNGPS